MGAREQGREAGVGRGGRGGWGEILKTDHLCLIHFKIRFARLL